MCKYNKEHTRYKGNLLLAVQNRFGFDLFLSWMQYVNYFKHLKAKQDCLVFFRGMDVKGLKLDLQGLLLQSIKCITLYYSYMLKSK